MSKKRRGLRADMPIDDFRAYYWMKSELIAFARRLGLSTRGYKPELSKRIERRLRGLEPAERLVRPPNNQRDSARPLRRSTPVVHYKNDARTRAFVTSQIGPHFHFTYHVNQYRLTHRDLTYGDLVDEWIAEFNRRRRPTYKAPLAAHGEYNRYIRDYFADPENAGRTLRDAAASWMKAKPGRGDRRYQRKR
jgi:hypothetical protein